MAVAAWQLVVEELIDEVFVELLRCQAAARHPMREVRQGAQALLDATFGVAASLQQRPEGIEVRRQGAIEQPCSSQGVQRSDRVHVGLQLWDQHPCANPRIMYSAVEPLRSAAPRYGGSPACGTAKLFITGTCA